MGVSWGLLAPFIALSTTVAVTQAAVVLTGFIRERSYRRFEDERKEDSRDDFRFLRLTCRSPKIAENPSRRRSIRHTGPQTRPRRTITTP